MRPYYIEKEGDKYFYSGKKCPSCFNKDQETVVIVTECYEFEDIDDGVSINPILKCKCGWIGKAKELVGDTKTTTLYRSVNKAELDLIVESDWTEFPSRMKYQPYFYPVLSLSYAKKLNDWNIRDYGEGFIVEFDLDNRFMSLHEVHNVGDKDDNELWIKSDLLPHLNISIIGKIRFTKSK